MKDLSKLSLKKVKFHEDMSEETPCFSALLVDDGVIVAYVKNDGRGGCNSLHRYDDSDTVNLYEKYGDLDTDCHIMGLAEDWNAATLYQSNALVLKKGNNISTVGYGNNTSITKLKKTVHNYPEWMRKNVKKWEAEGYTVLNRNL